MTTTVNKIVPHEDKPVEVLSQVRRLAIDKAFEAIPQIRRSEAKAHGL
jgi:hypothetical protein